MMDVDDGYVLWTGIWKGMLKSAQPHRRILRLMWIPGLAPTYFTRLWYAVPRPLLPSHRSKPSEMQKVCVFSGKFV